MDAENEKLRLIGDPDDAEAYLREFAAGEISYNPQKLMKVYVARASETTGLEQQVYQALAWAVGATRAEGRARQQMRDLERRVRALEERLAQREGDA